MLYGVLCNVLCNVLYVEMYEVLFEVLYEALCKVPCEVLCESSFRFLCLFSEPQHPFISLFKPAESKASYFSEICRNLKFLSIFSRFAANCWERLRVVANFWKLLGTIESLCKPLKTAAKTENHREPLRTSANSMRTAFQAACLQSAFFASRSFKRTLKIVLSLKKEHFS